LFIFGRLTFVTIKFSELCSMQVWVRSRDGLDLDWIGLDPDYSKSCWIWIRSGV